MRTSLPFDDRREMLLSFSRKTFDIKSFERIGHVDGGGGDRTVPLGQPFEVDLVVVAHHRHAGHFTHNFREQGIFEKLHPQMARSAISTTASFD